MKRPSLNLILTFGLFFSLGLVAILIQQINQNFDLVINQNQSVSYTIQIIYTSERVMHFLKEAESGQRGFIISQDSSFIRVYNRAVDSTLVFINRLQSLTIDNPMQQEQIGVLKNQTKARIQVLQNNLGLSAQELAQPAYRSRFAKGKLLSNQVHTSIQKIIQTEQELLRVRENDLKNSVNLFYNYYFYLIFSILLLATLLVVVTRIQLSQSKQQNQVLKQKNTYIQSLNDQMQTYNEELKANNEIIQDQAEQLLILNEKKYQTLLDSIQDIFCAFDRDLHYVYLNPAGEKFINKTIQEVSGKHYLEVFPESVNSQYPSFFESVLRTNQPQTLLTKSERYEDIYIELTAYPSEFGISLFVKDVTQSKAMEIQLRESEQKYKFLFEHHPTPLWLYDKESLSFLAINETAIHKYGYSRAEFMQMTLRDIRLNTEIEKLENVTKQLKAGYSESLQWKHRKKNGALIDVEIHSYGFTDKGKEVRLVTINDITERLKVEKEKEVLIDELSKFASYTSHHIRRPIANILGLIGIFNFEDITDNLNSQILEKILVVAQDLDVIIHKMNNMLESSGLIDSNFYHKYTHHS